MINEESYLLKKSELKNYIEPFIFEQLNKETYTCKRKSANSLLTWNRFDLAFKLFYLDMKAKNLKLATDIYAQDIKAQTLGEFKEFGSTTKDSFEAYIQEFETTVNSISENGFDSQKTLIPLANNSSILNGAHRVASAIHLNKTVTCVELELEPYIIDYKYFYDRDVSSDTLDIVANKFIEYADNVYLAFLWPSGIGFKEEAENKFSNIVYKKDIRLNAKGAHNLLTELYKHMDWSGNPEDGYKGIHQKLLECFPNFETVRVIAFQADSLESVREIKENVRQIYNIGFSSIHITDTKEEAIRISRLIFNENGLHFLNNAEPYKYLFLHQELQKFLEFISKNKISIDDVVIDSSTILAIYGIRKNKDLDYLSLNNIATQEDYDSHESELKYHCVNNEDLIYNPKYYFQYKGLKFISFSQLYQMKKKRNEEKDINDCKLMDAFIEDNRIKKIVANLKQKLFYTKIKLHRDFTLLKINILKRTGLYKPLKWLYHKIKELKK